MLPTAPPPIRSSNHTTTLHLYRPLPMITPQLNLQLHARLFVRIHQLPWRRPFHFFEGYPLAQCGACYDLLYELDGAQAGEGGGLVGGEFFDPMVVDGRHGDHGFELGDVQDGGAEDAGVEVEEDLG